MTFEQIKRNYDRKLWNKQMGAKAVEKGVITAAIQGNHGQRFEQLTGPSARI